MTGASLEYSGYYVGNLLYHVDIHGSWQSSTTRYSATSYYLVIEDNDIIYPQGDYGKYVGRPVRCVFSSWRKICIAYIYHKRYNKDNNSKGKFFNEAGRK
ncbi:hypothetical protein IKG12_00360 [Candidatus Saccharibacteria bacterium]|nr:hypothetical protein [Candidatus Saccharibacteria bacterium]